MVFLVYLLLEEGQMIHLHERSGLLRACLLLSFSRMNHFPPFFNSNAAYKNQVFKTLQNMCATWYSFCLQFGNTIYFPDVIQKGSLA